jgi:hypothetical protein
MEKTRPRRAGGALAFSQLSVATNKPAHPNPTTARAMIQGSGWIQTGMMAVAAIAEPARAA